MYPRPKTLFICFLGTMVTALTQVVPADPDSSDDVVELSPFVVSSAEETGYQASNTLAGTRLKTSLKDVGAAVSVYTEEFLSDIGVTNIEDILTYTASTEGGGFNGNYSGIGGESSDEARDNPSGVNRVRALATATRTRDYFATDIPSDTYNFNSLTVSRGPNAVLAGIGSAGGIIDTSLRQANFNDFNQAVVRFGSYDSHREELHFNKVLVDDRVAIRMDLLNDRTGFRQDPTYEEDQRAYFATQIRLRQATPGAFLGRTTLRANYEKGEISGVPPNQLTPVLSMQSWFDNDNPDNNKWSVNGALQKTYNGNGAVINPAGGNTIAGFPLFRSWAIIFADPNSTAAGVGFADASLAGVQGFQGTIPGGAQGPGGYLRGTGDSSRNRAGFYRTRLLDSNVFDFYNNLMTGAFDYREQSFDALNVRLEQLLLGGKAGFELAYDHQKFDRLRDFSVGTGEEEIYVDTNAFLSVRSDLYPQGIPNPNFGRPFIVSRDTFRDQSNSSLRESVQATAFFRHDFTQSDSRWARMLGRHDVSGLYFKTTIENVNETYASTWDPAGPLNPATSIGQAPGAFASQVNAWFYIGDSLLNTDSLADVRLNPITSGKPQYGETYTLQVYDPATKKFVTGTSTPLRILKNLRGQEQQVASQALTLQSRWFKDHVITLLGWRKDESDAFTSADLPTLADGNQDRSQYELFPAVSQTEESLTKSVVVKVPASIMGRFPIGRPAMRIFYNDSENFSPEGQRRNVWNEELGSPSASTREYGVMLTLLDGKVDLRINRFKTQIKDDAVGGVPNPYGYINTMIVRTTGAQQAGLLPADYGYIDPSFNTFEDVARAFFATIPTRLADNMGADKNFDPHFTGTGNSFGWEPDNVTNRVSISDTVSTGTEYELTVNPTRSWRIALNVAKNEAVKANVAAEELALAYEWINNVKTMFNGALANGWRNPPVESGMPLVQYQMETVNDIETANALSGTVSPEIRKWRANLITRYQFREGFLKGFSVGGAMRWQDKVGIGYPFIKDENNNDIADLANPYYGPSDTMFDLALGYERKLTIFGSKVDWHLGLNVRNLNAKDELIPIKANADGSYGTVRIAPNRTWALSNSIRF